MTLTRRITMMFAPFTAIAFVQYLLGSLGEFMLLSAIVLFLLGIFFTFKSWLTHPIHDDDIAEFYRPAIYHGGTTRNYFIALKDGREFKGSGMAWKVRREGLDWAPAHYRDCEALHALQEKHP